MFLTQFKAIFGNISCNGAEIDKIGERNLSNTLLRCYIGYQLNFRQYLRQFKAIFGSIIVVDKILMHK